MVMVKDMKSHSRLRTNIYSANGFDLLYKKALSKALSVNVTNKEMLLGEIKYSLHFQLTKCKLLSNQQAHTSKYKKSRIKSKEI